MLLNLFFFQRADAVNNEHRQGCKHLTQAVCTVGSEIRPVIPAFVVVVFGLFLWWWWSILNENFS